MEPHSPLFANPPVVEVVLGVQFAALTNFTSGHLGWFWKRFLDGEWERATDAPTLPDQFETFEKRRRAGPAFQVKLDSPARPRRLQIANQAGDRLIQIQPTQFIYNWLKKEGHYPSFRRVYEEFANYFRRFRTFVEEAKLGDVVPNQWEITYVDQIPAGNLWQSPSDWHRILPGLLGPQPGVDGLHLESAGGEWHYEITPAQGRLHISIQQGMTEGEEPALLLQTTARGSIGKDSAPDLETGLNLGHEVIRRAFLGMTSAEAQAAWGRRQT
jgi:uncharacterized protein (TIGR04255 family)